MLKTKRKFDKEFKETAIKFYLSENKSMTDASIDLGISHYHLSRWLKEYIGNKDNAFPGNGNPRDKEIYELKKKITELKEERDILKKVMAIFS